MNENFNWKPSVREDFFNALQKSIVGTRFNKIENSTSVITIKQILKKNKKVIVDCDFSVIYYPVENDSKSGYYKYSRLNKEQNNFTWEIRNISRFNDDKHNWLFENYDGIWQDIKGEYLKLKERDKQNKHSFILYHEAINNIYNQCNQENLLWIFL